MGKRGPPPTPTSVLKKRGSWLANVEERQGTVGVDVEVITPEKPHEVEVDDYASRKWDELVPQLESMDVLNSIDGHILARYCASYSQWFRAWKKIHDEYGGEMTFVIRNEAGEIMNVRPFPEVRIMKEAHAICRNIELQFGMTPSSRATLKTNKSLNQESGQKALSAGEKASRFFTS